MVPWRGCLIGVVAVAVAFLSYRALPRNRLTVTNESGQPVRCLTVSIGGKTIDFPDLGSGDSATADFTFSHEDVFDVKCKLADGTVVEDSADYVVWEEALFGIEAQLVIGPGGVLHCSH